MDMHEASRILNSSLNDLRATETRVAKLTAALEKYGQHRPDCDSFGPPHCGCGFRAVLGGLR